MYHQPIRTMILPEMVALYVPRLHDDIEAILGLIDQGEVGSHSSGWAFHTWEGKRHALTLEVEHHGVEFGLSLPPELWDSVIPALLRCPTVGIVTMRRFYDEAGGAVTPFYLDEQDHLVRTMYKVFGVSTGLKRMVSELETLRGNWNSNGVLTYLLQILGSGSWTESQRAS